MFPLFSNDSLFDSEFGQNENQSIGHEISRINRLYVISGVALWFQQYNMVHLTDNWHTIFRVSPDEMLLLEDYLALIDAPQERQRIHAARESLIAQPPGFEWCDEFTLCGQKVRSTAVVAQGCIFGMDRIM